MDLAELLPLYALGALDGDEAAEVARAVAADPALAAELDALVAATVELADAAPGVAPSPAVRARLLTSVESRFDRFVARMTELFDVAADRARELLAMIDRRDAWEPGPTPGSWLIHFQAGPRLAGADTGFVRLAPGERFAWHRHTGDEQNLVLAGVADDSLAGRLEPGAEAFAPAGTEHDFVNIGDEDFVFAVWVWGVDFDIDRPRAR